MTCVCPNCKSSNIETLAWVSPNTKEVVDWIDSSEAVFCNDCESHSDHFIILEEQQEEV